jgi:hypothetical protein
MGMPRWSPREELSKQEQFVISRLKRTRRLFEFLRAQRHVRFDESFQQELEAMHRATGEGKVPVPPGLLAMVVLLQAYTGASDAEAVEHAILDARWQLVLEETRTAAFESASPSKTASGEYRATRPASPRKRAAG